MSVQLGWSYIKVLGYRVSDRKFLGYWRVGDSAVGSDQGAGESEGCGEGWCYMSMQLLDSRFLG